MTRATPGDKHREELERLAFGLALHGTITLDATVIRRLAESPVWLQLRILLLEYGFSQAEVSELMGRHPVGCPCWKCVLGLNSWARAHHLKLKAKAGTRRRPLI